MTIRDDTGVTFFILVHFIVAIFACGSLHFFLAMQIWTSGGTAAADLVGDCIQLVGHSVRQICP